ncbi:class I SAM-dependent methyltransferase [Actinoplanes sp. NPDC051851]|uniref:class I SAM-dependent methyltransferase n=1 Tax=Actinoplanes sp. NPDC051851 TaxID=3154753 RepID=UPI00342E37FC
MTTRHRPGYSGTGPGTFTPDGCAVDLYSRIPPGREPEIIAAAVPPPATLLELGCGAGRVTRPLSFLGYAVTAVDESPAMLDRLGAAATPVCSPIEDLDLPTRFDVVLLSSFLVHAPDPAVRRALLATCRRHVAPSGVVLIQREGTDWHTRVPRSSPLGDGTARVLHSTPDDEGIHTVHVEYTFPDATWTQQFRSRPLSTPAFEEVLNTAGLSQPRYLTADHTWAAAKPL